VKGSLLFLFYSLCKNRRYFSDYYRMSVYVCKHKAIMFSYRWTQPTAVGLCYSCVVQFVMSRCIPITADAVDM